ncbi:hypothetical protein L0657_27155 [Dyadobacter sp. CY345]|uniref:hypothetical protein n=1 Tax=Dyadobacter sp. CY345 TaxID=2909335 RepID=UPI001F48534B|nr:hypothetical protein [Dyadobacter sp. CY345]MCF2447663.1 hypothetical protein [Dyadobacter sp. CY345]
MKNALFLLILFLVISCNQNDKSDPTPNPDVISKQQAPFGSQAVDVKLQKVFSGGKLVTEYIYEGDFLFQEKNYLLFDKPALWATRTLLQENGIAKSFNVVSAQFSGEGGWVSDDFKPFYNITFNEILNDSVRNLTVENPSLKNTSLSEFKFDRDGFISKQTNTTKYQKEADYIYTYLRDASHNIVEARRTSRDKPGKVSIVKYEYDTNPNPFFKLGLHFELVSIDALSPNNIVLEKRLAEDGSEYITDYKYEYNTNGYPRTLIVQARLPLSKPQTLEFEY